MDSRAENKRNKRMKERGSAMKKTVAVLLLIIWMISCFVPMVSAEDALSEIQNTENQEFQYEALRNNAVTYNCQYDREASVMRISGSVSHDVMITYSKYLIEVYRILPQSSFEEVIGSPEENPPLASVAISVKFEFAVDVDQTAERFSRYAIALRSPEGEVILAAEPQYAGVVSEYVYSGDDRSSYKGIETDYTSLGGAVGCGTAVIPVYLNQLLSKVSNGYIYPIEQSYRYFDRAYIDELDVKIRTYSASGCRVYLQLLLPAVGSDLACADGKESMAEYDMPNVLSGETMPLLCAFSEFLAQRYDSYQSGRISGLIIGKQIDQRGMNYCGELTLEEYSERYAFYVMVMANSARDCNPQLDIVLPFGNTNSYSVADPSIGVHDYDPAKLLESVLMFFDEKVSFAFQCSTMIESKRVPFDISDQTLSTFMDGEYTVSEKLLCAENLEVYSSYLNGLPYESAPDHFIYLWSVPDNLSGNALACAYAYTYYTLLNQKMISSFTVSFAAMEKKESDVFLDLENILRYIDTADSLKVTENLLPYFHAEAWSDAVRNFSTNNLSQRLIYHLYSQNLAEKAWTGAFSYFDFSLGNTEEWFLGSYGKDLRTDYAEEDLRALCALSTSPRNGEYSDLLCLYEYPENLIYTPFVKFTVAFSDTSAQDTNLYELVISMGNDQALLTSSYIIPANEKTQIILDLSNYNTANMVNYIKLSTRSVTGDSEEYTLRLYEITGYSTVYSSEDLAGLIEAERLKIRNQLAESEQDEEKQGLIWMIFGILFAVTAIVAGLYMGLRKETEPEVSEEKKNDPSDQP